MRPVADVGDRPQPDGTYGYGRIYEPITIGWDRAKGEALVGFGGGPGWGVPGIEAIGPDGERVVNDANMTGARVPPHVVLRQVGAWQVRVRDRTTGCVRDISVTVVVP